MERLETSLHNAEKELEGFRSSCSATEEKIVLLEYENNFLKRMLFEKGEERT